MSYARPQDPIVGRTLGEFVLVEKIGEGGFGSVYRAKQPLLDREAVVKVLHTKLQAAQALTERFLREARLASKLDHPYAAHIYAFGAESDGALWIAMELVRGTPLDQILKVQGPLAIERFVPLLDRICEVVHTAHEQGIVHRDLKPANVMVLSRAGRLLPKLLDFGIAKALAQAPTDPGMQETHPDVREEEDPAIARTLTPSGPALTQRGAIMGSPPYMAPEQWLDAATVDARTDLYALAVLAYEALTGRLPFPGATVTQIAEAHARKSAPPLGPRFPPALDTVFAKALAKHAKERYATAIDVAAAFRQASGIGAEPASLPALEETIREATLAGAPQPIAEAAAALEAARNAHQARDAMWLLVRTIVRTLGLFAIACRTRVSGRDADSAPVSDALRALYRRPLTDTEWLALARESVRAFVSRRDAYPIPELVDVFFEPGSDAPAAAGRRLEAVVALRDESEGGEERLTELLERGTDEISKVLRDLEWLTAYALVIPVAPRVAEQWMGVRRTQRSTMAVRGRALPVGEPALLDRDGAPVLSLAPLFQAAPPTPGAPLELFLFEGRGRRGAKLVAVPTGFEHHDETLWDWFRAQLSGSLDEAETRAAEERPPYRGLSTFSPGDAAMFFGREKLVDAFLNRLLVQPLLAVVGRSGAGKSSFVQAGVVPALPAGWRALTMRPGPSPLATLTARLHHAGIEASDASAVPDRLRADAAERGPILLVVDQLEELFTLCHDPEERRRFVDVLAGVARSAEDPARVVLTLRDDFLVRAEQLPALQSRLAQGLQLLTVPAAEDLLRILVEPARRVSYEFEDPALPAEMVKEVADQPGALALISFAAAKLWDLRDRHFRQLTRKAYRSLGGVGGALARHAETTLEEMPPEERRLAREAFRHLVTSQSTRAVLKREELRQILGGGAHADGVIEKLVAARLLVASEGESGEDLIEIIHEALLSAWPRLVEWRREDAEGARLREQLRAAARQWEERGRPRGLLWRDEALADYQRWRARHAAASLTEGESAFAQASVGDAARGRRRARITVATAFATLAAGLALVLALYQRANTSDQRSKTQLAASYLDQGRQLLLAGDPVRGMVYLSDAYSRGAEGPALHHLIGRAAGMLRVQLAIGHHSDWVVAVAFSPDGRRLATGSYDHTAKIWDATNGALLATLPASSLHVVGVQFSPDSKVVLTVAGDGARTWDADTGRPLVTLMHEKLSNARFSADGRRIVTVGHDGTARLWEAAGGTPGAILRGHRGPVFNAVFGGDGSTVWSMGQDKTVRAWSVADGAPVATLEGHTEGIVTAAVSRDGARLASAAFDGTVRVWETNPARALWVLDARAPVIFPRPPSFSADGNRLAAIADRDVHVWDLGTGRIALSLRGHTGTVQWVEYSADGTRILTASSDGTARAWDATSGQLVSTFSGHTGEAVVAAWSPDGTRAATAGTDSTVRLWDAGSQRLVAALHGHDGTAQISTSAWTQATFSPDGARVLTAGHDSKARVWDVASGRVVRVLESSGGISGANWSPSGDRVVSTSLDRTARIWSVDSGEVLNRLEGHGAEVWYASFNDDGTLVVTTCEDGAARVFDARTGALQAKLDHDRRVSTAAFGPNGTILTAMAGQAVLWDWRAQRVVTRLGEPGTNVNTAAFGPDGRLVVLASTRGIEIWDPAKPEQVSLLTGHTGMVLSAAFAPDGERIVSASTDGTARVWDRRTGQPIDVQTHGAPVSWAIFSPDGQRVVSAGHDGTALVWETRLDGRPADRIAALVRTCLPFRLGSDGRLLPTSVAQFAQECTTW